MGNITWLNKYVLFGGEDELGNGFNGEQDRTFQIGLGEIDPVTGIGQIFYRKVEPK